MVLENRLQKIFNVTAGIVWENRVERKELSIDSADISTSDLLVIERLNEIRLS